MKLNNKKSNNSKLRIIMKSHFSTYAFEAFSSKYL